MATTTRTPSKSPSEQRPTLHRLIESARKKQIHELFRLARLIGETGPLGDFASWRMLLRYAGLNIRMRQSGTYRGQYRITKKGRPLLRKILSQIVLPLVRRKCLYGEFYHRKRLAMPGQKAMVVVMRNFLRKLHGWYRSGRAFDIECFFNAVPKPERRAA